MKDFLVKLIKNPYVLNLLLAVVVACALVFGTLKWLDSYTRHNEAVVVPDVKGLGLRLFERREARCDCRAGPDGRFEGEGRTYRVCYRKCAHFADGDNPGSGRPFVPAGLRHSSCPRV